jgi:hypothetical protein
VSGFKVDPDALGRYAIELGASAEDLSYTASYVSRWTDVEARGAGFLASLLGTHQEFSDSLENWLNHMFGLTYQGRDTLGNVAVYYASDDNAAAARLDALLPPPPYPAVSDSSQGQRR